MPEPDSTGAAAESARPPLPSPADDGAVRQKVLIGGVVLLFALTLVGLAVVITNSGGKPTTEPTYVPPPPDTKAAPAVPGPPAK